MSVAFGYHRIIGEGASGAAPDGHPLPYAGYGIPADAFRRQADLWSGLGVAAPDDAAGEGRVVLTFDDGWESDASIAAPLLHERGLTAVFHVVAGWVGDTPGVVDWSDLGEMLRMGMRVGCHSMTHPDLDALNDDALEREIAGAADLIRERLGTDPASFALPRGRVTPRVLRAVGAAGFGLLFTSVPGTRRRVRDGIVIVPRYAVRPGMTEAALERLARGNALEGARWRLRWWVTRTLRGVLGPGGFRALRARLRQRAPGG